MKGDEWMVVAGDLNPAKWGTLRNLNEISPEILAELRGARSQLEAEREHGV